MIIKILIPDHLFEAAELLAKRLGMSRSELYSKAVASYVDANRSLGVREQLDAVYATESSRIEDDFARIQFASVLEENW